MYSLTVALIASLLISYFFVRLAKNQHFLLDHDTDGIQKTHTIPVPRVGGVAIYLAAIVGVGLIHFTAPEAANQLFTLLACTLPAVVGGVLEDITKKISPLKRLGFMAVSSGISFYVLDLAIVRTDIPFVDTILTQWPWLGLALTLLALLTITNAINLIDGFHGLASMSSIFMLIGIAWVAYQVHDPLVLSCSLILIGSTAGFLFWNFPKGKIFLGDGGAYFLGFMLGVLSILLVQRHAQVSPWFAVLLLSYPLVEVIFSVYRRKFLKGTASGLPDANHLHQLIHKRIVGPQKHPKHGNARTSVYLWVLSICSTIPAIIFYNQTLYLIPFVLLFCVSYLWIYSRIVRLKVPKWIKWWGA